MKYLFNIFLCLALIVSCERTEPPGGLLPNPEPPVEEQPPVDEPPVDETPAITQINHPGLMYVWDESVIPEITVHIKKDEWNALLKRYDEFDHNVDYFHADFTYKKGDDVFFIEDGGLRLRGNTSRRRPEGKKGQMHQTDKADWQHCHFGINFRKFHKDDAHTINGIRKVNLKWFKDDPCYVRELYCYDLYRRYGIWTAAYDVYCRLWIHVEGDSEPAYYGVYEMIEPVDDKFVEKRVDNMFGSEDGNLWKCGWSNKGAFLDSVDAHFGLDEDTGENFTYEYKGDEDNYDAAVDQLKDFILKLNGKSDESFYQWIKEVCDVELLLKTYAVNVAVGMWDDHWNNGNNFYMYFNSYDKYNYKFFLIPYDYDNSLGTTLDCGVQSDAGRHDPYNWGDKGVLMKRLMKHQEFRDIYKNALLELIDPAKGLFDVDASVARIEAWQAKVREFVPNDTGEDMEIKDRPASWSSHGEYRLLDKGSNNFFKVKAEAIRKMK